MALDTTVVGYSCNPLIELYANQGTNLGIGGTVLEYAPYGNPDISPTGTIGWRPFGISETAISFAQTLETYQPKVGMVSKSMDSKETGRMIEIVASMIAPTFMGKKFALASNTATITEPTVPITTTVDDTIAPTNWSVTLTAVTGFVDDQEIGILTGQTGYLEEEYTEIDHIDVASKTVFFKFPVFQLPADGAAVRVIKTKSLDTIPCDGPGRIQVRKIKYDRSKGKPRIEHGADARIKAAGGIDEGDGKTEAKWSFTLELIAKYDIASGNFKLSRYTEINP